jgi:hypothetical protein
VDPAGRYVAVELAAAEGRISRSTHTVVTEALNGAIEFEIRLLLGSVSVGSPRSTIKPSTLKGGCTDGG